MTNSQNGITTTFILITLVALLALGGVVYFYQNQQKLNSINSFEDCAKYYPVMESYPAQCNTSDGRHFVQELTEEEKQSLVPPQESGQVCTMDVKICPDGSSAGRTGPNCEFAPCISE